MEELNTSLRAEYLRGGVTVTGPSRSFDSYPIYIGPSRDPCGKARTRLAGPPSVKRSNPDTR
jgi:hypothetical protein